MSGRSSHGGSLSDVVHSADEAPANAVGGRSMRPDRDRNRDEFLRLMRNLAQPSPHRWVTDYAIKRLTRGKQTAETDTRRAGYGNLALFLTVGNHVGLRGLPGGAEGIRTDGHRGFPPANRGISPANLKGYERQTRLRKATQP